MDAVNGPNAAVTFALLVATVTQAFRYLLGVIARQDAQIQKSNDALMELSKASAEVAALVPVLMKENMEWKERYETLTGDQPA